MLLKHDAGEDCDGGYQPDGAEDCCTKSLHEIAAGQRLSSPADGSGHSPLQAVGCSEGLGSFWDMSARTSLLVEEERSMDDAKGGKH